MNGLEKALEKYNGNGSALARDLNVSPQAFSQWRIGARPLPIDRAEKISELTGVSLAELLPELAKRFK